MASREADRAAPGRDTVMRALVVRAPDEFAVEDVERPRPGDFEVLCRVRAVAILDFMGLGGLAQVEARNLPYGKQRLLEIARALALDPVLLLLDEPAGGLTTAEIGHLEAVIAAVSSTGVGVLLAEHHTDFVFRLCSGVTTLDRGTVIAQGTPDTVRRDPEVNRVYLGA